MIHNIVQSALRQRFLVLVLVILLIVAGSYSYARMPVDAYPDLSPPMVELSRSGRVTPPKKWSG